MAFVLNNCPQTLGPSLLVFRELFGHPVGVSTGELRERFGVATPADGRGDDIQHALDFLVIVGLAKRENDRYRVQDWVPEGATGNQEVAESSFRSLLLVALARGERRENTSRFVLDIYGYLLVKNNVLASTDDTDLHIGIRNWFRERRWDLDMQAHDIDINKFPNKEKMRHWTTICSYLGLIHKLSPTQYVLRPDPQLLLKYCVSKSPIQHQRRLPLVEMLDILQDLFGMPGDSSWTLGLSRWIQAVVNTGESNWMLDDVPDAGPRYKINDAGLLVRDSNAGMNVLTLR